MKAIVFVLRGCPAGCLGAYGNEWVGTPHLDRLAAGSVVFDRHISDRPDPAAASAAWLGGGLLESLRAAGARTVLVRANHPDTDGPVWYYAGWAEVFDARPEADDDSPLDALLRDLPALLDRFAAEEHALLWVETDRLLPPWDVRQDIFEAYLGRGDDEEEEEGRTTAGDEDDEEAEGDEGEEDEDEEVDSESDAEEEVEAADEVAEEPASSDPRSPTPDPRPAIPPWSDPPTGPFDAKDPDAWEWLHSTFAAVVTALDAELGQVFEALKARGLDQSAAWVVTSDFGYPLGEHGQVGPHRPWLHTELVHLPLIVRLPGAAEACRRVTGFTQPPDLAPTLRDLFGLPADGMSLLPLARGAAESTRPHAVTSLELNGASERALRTDEFAFLLPLAVPEGEAREPLLYDKPDDRWEVNDMRARKIDQADELERELREEAK
ncbi:sulfatase : Arylsulfatase A family protein OS=Singulisphaera acidiphila (strain ATCC BAA-1392 / DSM 18658 / VKM B-2454 / MOB10) GN=Sinac_7268 PE=4 SV=1: Sulfatase [Gemmataceae bacterium]|nr:sulfatase : Arylsulfatase A family protein OS=Singulisphaera acidiphila (strain ATCC BAA-1392 / DSM 18658 / VKM B-2454 / MOB10) GN=Sinac_7268 PE=4 SV=1: Sulfatase [Gemmataceae bacterium]VTU00213.1 sulfatase : Arylsulfatase A family protein OS=Singulisphaera acidiphila (strain ATCC BAA-1392 / DSM 18658 / VKM B-2454 / MOB10) GN=Sinac_7268 PE=4 SV=1: Sulfatase [Gemmataceae bacterium]